MPKNPTIGEVLVYPAKGGLETISIPGTTTLGRLIDGDNFIIDVNGSKRKHPGIERRQDDESNPLSPEGETHALFDFWRTSGSAKSRQTVAISSGLVWADTNGDGNYVDVTGGFSILPEANAFMETFFGLLVIAFTTNPGNQILKYDQTTLAALGGSPPNGKYLRTWLSRLWIAGIGTAPDRLRGSVIDDPEDWSAGNGSETINIDQGDQDPFGITSLFPPMFGRMVVGKRRALYEVTPVSSTFGVRALTNGIGCISHGGVAAIEDDIIFPSERGIHSIAMTDKYGQVENTYLSYPIQNYYLENVSYSRSENMRAIYAPELNSYLLSMTTSGSSNNNTVLGYNFPQGEWFRWDENVSAWAQYVDPLDFNKTKTLLMDDAGRVGILDGRKSGQKITWFDERRTMKMRVGSIYPMGVNNEVTFRRLRLFVKPQDDPNSKVVVNYLVNGIVGHSELEFPQSPGDGAVIGAAEIGVDIIGASGNVKMVTRELRGVGTAIEFEMTHTPVADDDDCEIYGFVIEYEYSGETYQPKTM